MMQNIKITITGKVYKVGFRYFVKQIGLNLNLCGIVKYSSDHRIIIEVSGNENAINQLVAYCRLGSPGAQVEQLIVSESKIQHKDSFTIQFENSVEDYKI